eukprot:sb/3472055/
MMDNLTDNRPESWTEARMVDESEYFQAAISNKWMAVLIPVYAVLVEPCLARPCFPVPRKEGTFNNVNHPLVMASFDILSGLSAPIHATILVFFVVDAVHYATVSTITAFLITGVTARMSTWVQLLLSVTRTIMIVAPTCRIRLRGVLTTLVAIVFLLWCGLAVFDVYTILPFM